jgi:hypothetical protein
VFPAAKFCSVLLLSVSLVRFHFFIFKPDFHSIITFLFTLVLEYQFYAYNPVNAVV